MFLSSVEWVTSQSFSCMLSLVDCEFAIPLNWYVTDCFFLQRKCVKLSIKVSSLAKSFVFHCDIKIKLNKIKLLVETYFGKEAEKMFSVTTLTATQHAACWATVGPCKQSNWLLKSLNIPTGPLSGAIKTLTKERNVTSISSLKWDTIIFFQQSQGGCKSEMWVIVHYM